MTFYKLKNKSLITNCEIKMNQKYGLPVEIFCPKQNQTIAFGKIETFCNDNVQINGQVFNRSDHAIFGLQSTSA